MCSEYVFEAHVSDQDLKTYVEHFKIVLESLGQRYAWKENGTCSEDGILQLLCTAGALCKHETFVKIAGRPTRRRCLPVRCEFAVSFKFLLQPSSWSDFY